MVLHITNMIWKQIRHTKSCLRMSIIYVALVPANPNRIGFPMYATDFVVRPLFRTMKCINPSTRSARGKCMVFIDEFGLVYHNWKDFVENTKYPDTTIVAPRLGVFDRSETTGEVQLISFTAPRTAEIVEAEQIIETGMTNLGLASLGVFVASILFPIAAPIVTAATYIGTGVGVLSATRSVGTLMEQNHREQDISFTSEHARGHWLAIVGSLAAFGAAGAASAVRSATIAGTVTPSLLRLSNSMFFAAVFVNGVSVGNSVLTAVNRGTITPGEVLQLSAALFLFTHSVYNFRTAQQLQRDTFNQHTRDYQETLSRNGQRRFRNRLNGRIRNQGFAAAAGDQMRNLNSAEHYNTNFRGTPGYERATSGVQYQRMQEKLAAAFVLHKPRSMEILVGVHMVIVERCGEEMFELFKKMAERILERYAGVAGFTIEDVIFECYEVVKNYAERRGIPISAVLALFDGFSYSSIPPCVKYWFEVFIPEVGTVVCRNCGGRKFEIEHYN